MNKFAMFALLVCVCVFTTKSKATVLYQENYDSWPSTFKTLQDPPSPWCDSCGSTGSVVSENVGGVSHSSAEIITPGRGETGQSYGVYRNGSTFVGSWSGGQTLREAGGSFKELYMRWYMKVPTAFSFANVYWQKIFRFNFSDGSEIYFDWINEGQIGVCPNSGGVDCYAQNISSPTVWHDGEWHAHQVYVNISTGTITYWIDGVQVYNKSGVANMPATSAVFGTGAGGVFVQHFPWGNEDGGATYQAGWQKLEVDDLVIATTKDETDPIEGATAALSISAGTTGIGAGTTTIQ